MSNKTAGVQATPAEKPPAFKRRRQKNHRRPSDAGGFAVLPYSGAV